VLSDAHAVKLLLLLLLLLLVLQGLPLCACKKQQCCSCKQPSTATRQQW
jgi:hypothetical protein